MKPLDDIDMKIVTYLERGLDVSHGDMARELGVSVATVYNRIRRLKRIGVVRMFAEIDHEKLGYTLRALVGVCTNPKSRARTLNKLRRLPHVQRILEVTGRYDYVLEIVARDSSDLRRLLTDEMGNIDEAQRTETMMIMAVLGGTT